MTGARLLLAGVAIVSMCLSTPVFAQEAQIPPNARPAALEDSLSSGGSSISPRRASIVMLSAYTITALVQGLDAHSTFKALDAGAVEQNPLLTAVAGNRPAFIGLKAAIAAGLIYEGRGLAKRHKVAAVLALAAVNGVYLALAEHNYRVARTMRNR